MSRTKRILGLVILALVIGGGLYYKASDTSPRLSAEEGSGSSTCGTEDPTYSTFYYTIPGYVIEYVGEDSFKQWVGSIDDPEKMNIRAALEHFKIDKATFESIVPAISRENYDPDVLYLSSTELNTETAIHEFLDQKYEEREQEHGVKNITAVPDDNLPRLSIEELELDWLDADITVDQLEKNREYMKREISEDGMYLTYEMADFQYIFTTDEESWGKAAHKLLQVEIFGENGGTISGPRGIRIGDNFESVIEKFPQDHSWKDNQEGVFYGMQGVSYSPEFEKGSVTKAGDGSPDFMTLVPKGYPPFIKIHFNHNQVTRMILYYMTD